MKVGNFTIDRNGELVIQPVSYGISGYKDLKIIFTELLLLEAKGSIYREMVGGVYRWFCTEKKLEELKFEECQKVKDAGTEVTFLLDVRETPTAKESIISVKGILYGSMLIIGETIYHFSGSCSMPLDLSVLSHISSWVWPGEGIVKDWDKPMVTVVGFGGNGSDAMPF